MKYHLLTALAFFLLLVLPVKAQGPVTDELPRPILAAEAIEYTSDYLIGSYAIQIILVDCPDYPWTEATKQVARERVYAGLNWWKDLDTRADLSFVYREAHVTLDFEPTSVGYGEWIKATMLAMGYSEEDHWYLSLMKLDMEIRDTLSTDWATTLLITAKPGLTADGYYAAAWRNGPGAFFTYWLSEKSVAHEFGHIGGARDQYYSALTPCYARGGFLSIENQNSEYGDCKLDVPSIMKHSWSGYFLKALDWYARGQVGWHDYDCDGLFAPIDPAFNYVCKEYFFPLIFKN